MREPAGDLQVEWLALLARRELLLGAAGIEARFGMEKQRRLVGQLFLGCGVMVNRPYLSSIQRLAPIFGSNRRKVERSETRLVHNREGGVNQAEKRGPIDIDRLVDHMGQSSLLFLCQRRDGYMADLLDLLLRASEAVPFLFDPKGRVVADRVHYVGDPRSVEVEDPTDLGDLAPVRESRLPVRQIHHLGEPCVRKRIAPRQAGLTSYLIQKAIAGRSARIIGKAEGDGITKQRATISRGALIESYTRRHLVQRWFGFTSAGASGAGHSRPRCRTERP